MGCFISVIVIFMPRIFLFFGWILGFFAEVHPWDTRFWPIVGWVLAPYTTCVYGLCYVYNQGNFDNSLWTILMVAGIVADICNFFSSWFDD